MPDSINSEAGNLISRVRAGDQDAAEVVFDRYAQQLARLESLARASAPHLVRFEGDVEAASYPLGEQIVIGSDAAKSQITVDDPLLNPRHARLIRQPNGMWRIEDLRSRNGIWMRIEESAVERGCQFQLGEQRFLLKVN